MHRQIGDTILEVVTGNIATMEFDAVVNAAKSSLLGGAGVDGAIHHAAGPDLLDECRLLGGCQTGQAKVTQGYRLSSKHIVHTVGPVWQDGNSGEGDFLASCYLESMRAASNVGARTIGFPAVATGRYGFPIDKAAKIAVKTVADEASKNREAFDRIAFVCFDENAADTFVQALENY